MDSQSRGRWIWPLMAAAAVVAVVSVELWPGWSTDGDPVSATTQGPQERPAEPLVRGEVVTIDAVDATGPWGTITITRGPDTGGYPDNPIDEDAFIIEVFIDYTAARHPEPEEFGREDWALATAAERRPIGALYEWILPPNPGEWDPTRQELASFPGAIEIIEGSTKGMLYFLVPREFADQELELIYRPAGFSETVVGILIREAGPAPAPVSVSAPFTYVARKGSPITVLDSPEADALFVDPDMCTNPVGGYTVSYPDSWYTNTEIGDVPSCSWFSPTSFEVAEPGQVPGPVGIVVSVFEGVIGQIPEYPRTYSEGVVIDGVGFSRHEDTISTDPPDYSYGYAAWLDRDYLGTKLTAYATTMHGGDYTLNKAVLDRIMASMVLDDPTSDNAPGPASEANALFVDPDTCTNPVDGYTVSYPDAWYTNTEIGDIPACSWFSPTSFEVTEPGVAPEEIWISVGTIDSAFGYIGTTQVFASEELAIGGLQGRRVEYNPNPNGEPVYRGFHYAIELGESGGTGPTFIAQTDNEIAPDYALAKAVLDLIMASLEFTNVEP